MTIAMYSRTAWREVEPNFTVGQMNGEFAGTIERVGDRFEATTGIGEALGSYRSAAAAERALERAAEQRPEYTGAATLEGRRSVALTACMLAGIVATSAAAITALVSL